MNASKKSNGTKRNSATAATSRKVNDMKGSKKTAKANRKQATRTSMIDRPSAKSVALKDTAKVVAVNATPFRAGTNRAKMFAKVRKGMTVEKAFEAGVSRLMMRRAIANKFVIVR
jgi:hypothetical protein